MLTPEMSYYVAFRGKSAGRYVRFNDAVVLEDDAEEGRTFVDVVSLSDWVVLGPNRLEFELSPVGEGARMEVLVAAKSDAGVRVVHKWGSCAEVPAEVEFTVGPPLEGEPAAAAALEDEDEAEIRKAVVALHAAIRQGRIADAGAMLRPRLPRLCQRLGIEETEGEVRQREQLESLLSDGLELMPLSAGSIELTPVCRGKLIRAEVDGRAPICAKSGADPTDIHETLPLTFEKQAGTWVIAR